MTSNQWSENSPQRYDPENSAAVAMVASRLRGLYNEYRAYRSSDVESSRHATRAQRARASMRARPEEREKFEKYWIRMARFTIEHGFDPAEVMREAYALAPRVVGDPSPALVASENVLEQIERKLKPAEGRHPCHYYVDLYAQACATVANVQRAQTPEKFEKFLMMEGNGLDPVMRCFFGSQFPGVLKRWRKEVHPFLKLHPNYLRCLRHLGVTIEHLNVLHVDDPKAQS